MVKQCFTILPPDADKRGKNFNLLEVAELQLAAEAEAPLAGAEAVVELRLEAAVSLLEAESLPEEA